VLVLDEFWTPEERAVFRNGMTESKWKSLGEMPEVSAAFPNCGNWLKAEIGQIEAQALLDKLSLPCIAEYMESFSNITQRHLSFSYYSYGVGDCLSTHDDTDEAYSRDRQPYRALRRIALATYVHEEWNPDWGGELIVYEAKQRKGERVLEIHHCVSPKPGSLVLFTVPRFHRVCRVDSLAGPHKRLSIAGWFMTEHDA
jgi:SM-20-related protein